MRFQNKVFLITGGASGIGLAVARLLKQEGAALIRWDINHEALAAAGAELNCSLHSS